MILGIMEGLEEFANKVGKFVERNFDQPFFWITIFGVLLLIGLYGISKFAEK